MKVICAALFLCSPLFSAPQRLSQTDLYADISTKKVKETHHNFVPQYALWSDGARKTRWICFPPSTQIDNSDPDSWKFPVGTMVWKEFAFPRTDDPNLFRRVETRYLEKLKNGTWEMVTYVWNEDESDAELAPSNGLANFYPLAPGVKHDIPSVSQCANCHNKGGDKVLGFDELQLSDDKDPLALHIEEVNERDLPLTTLRYLVDRGLVKSPNPEWLTNAPRIHSKTDLGRAAMGYMHANCGHCHNPNGRAAMTRQYLRHSMQATDEHTEPAYLTTVNQPTRSFQIPGISKTFRILPAEPDLSAVHYRLDRGSMPSVGKKIIDRDAVEQIGNWIKTISGMD